MPSRNCSSGTIILGSALHTAPPCALFAWVKPAAGAAGTDTIGSFWNITNDCGLALESGDNKARIRAKNADQSFVTATVATAFTANLWTPVLGLWVATNDIRVYAGTRSNSAQSITTKTTSGINRASIGCRADGTNPFAGLLALWTAWDTATFSDEEIDALMSGVHPFGVQFAAMTAHVPLGIEAPEPDWAAGRTWPVSGTTIDAEGPPVPGWLYGLSAPEIDASSASELQAAISIGDVEYEAALALPATRGRMMAAIIDLDSDNGSIGLEIDGGGRVSTAVDGTWNGQTGSLVIGTGLAAGAAVDAGGTALRIAACEVHGAPLTGAARTAAWDRIADMLAPVVQDAAVTIPGAGATTVQLAPYVKDPSGRGWAIDSATADGAGLTVQVQGQSLRLTPAQEAASQLGVDVVVRNAWPVPRTASLRLSVTRQAVVGDAGAYAYEFAPPWLPSSPDQLEIVTVPTGGITIAGGSTHNGQVVGADPTKLTLLAAPAGTITGKLVLSNWKSRGVMMIGFTVKYTPAGSRTTPARNVIPFGHWAQISFESADYPANPFLWLSNGRYEAGTVQSGDCIQTGTRRNDSNNNFSEWLDVYIQKMHVPFGSYFFSDPTYPEGSAPAWDPHADFIQITNNRSTRRWRVANNDLAWSGQHFLIYSLFANYSAPHPQASILMRKTILRPNPPSLLVYPNDGEAQYRYVIVNSDPTNQYPALNFMPTEFLDMYAVKNTAANNQDGGKYFSPNGTENASGVVSWPTDKYPNNAQGRTPVQGTVKFGTPPAGLVDTSHSGHAWRVTTYDDLLNVF